MNSEVTTEVKKPRPRPLSPHLQVYSPLMTMVTSITHRATGVFLSLGILLLVCWLMILAFHPEKYEEFSTCLSGTVGQIGLFALTLALYYHLCNGIRHLLWDAGKGFHVNTIKWTGPLVIISALVLTLITWAAII